MMGGIAVNIRPPDGAAPVGETTGGVSEENTRDLSKIAM
jgi:hypothetical protein